MADNHSSRNPLHRAAMALAATGPGSRLLAPLLHHLDRAALRLTGGRHTLSGLLAGIPTITLTARGARTGRPRSVPLLGVPAGPDGRDLVVIASNWGQDKHPAWYHNVRAHPEVEVTTHGRRGRYRARELTGQERQRYWQKAVGIYPGFAAYRRRAPCQIPVVLLSPIE